MISEFFIVLNLFRFLVEQNWCHLFAFAWNFFFICKTYISGNIWSIYYKSISDRENFIILDNYYINVVGVGDVDGVCSWSGFSCVSVCSNCVGSTVNLFLKIINHAIWMCVSIRRLIVDHLISFYSLGNNNWTNGWIIKIFKYSSCVSVICACGLVSRFWTRSFLKYAWVTWLNSSTRSFMKF